MIVPHCCRPDKDAHFDRGFRANLSGCASCSEANTDPFAAALRNRGFLFTSRLAVCLLHFLATYAFRSSRADVFRCRLRSNIGGGIGSIIYPAYRSRRSSDGSSSLRKAQVCLPRLGGWQTVEFAPGDGSGGRASPVRSLTEYHNPPQYLPIK